MKETEPIFLFRFLNCIHSYKIFFHLLMKSENCSKTCRSSGEVKNLFRSYNSCIRFSRILADVIEMLQNSAIPSAVLTPIPLKTHTPELKRQLQNARQHIHLHQIRYVRELYAQFRA